MGLIIAEGDGSTIDLENKGLSGKTVRVVADTIGKFKHKILQANFGGNLLKDLECKVLLDAMSNQYKGLVSLSFRNNKFSSVAVTTFIEAFDKMKALETLDLSENMVSDEPAKRLFEKMEKTNSKLRQLSLSRNFIGKTVHALAMAEAFGSFLSANNSK